MKILLTLAFIVALNLLPSIVFPGIVLFLSLSLSVTLISQLGIRFVLARALLALPFVLGALPLVFAGPPPLVELTPLAGLRIPFSPEGASRFASIAARSWISVQAAIILAASTRMTELLTGLQQLGVPRLFITILRLMWRYLFVLLDEVTSMMQARASRSTSAAPEMHSGGTLAWRAKTTGGMAGSLFLRSIERSDRVYAAMLSRGYNGELPANENTRLSKQDWMVMTAGIVVLMCVWLFGALLGR